VRFHSLTYQEISARASAGATAVVPLGCTEQQGPHLAIGFDSWFAEELTLAAADAAYARFGVGALVLPVLPFGPTPEHRGFGAGYVDLPSTLHEAIVDAVLRSLAEQGFRRILVWRGCGAHGLVPTVTRFNEELAGHARAFLPSHPFHDVWCRLADPDVAGGHADSFATSIVMHRHPEHVRGDRVPGPSRPMDWSDGWLDFTRYSDSGVIGDPTHASPELGARLWEESVTIVAEILRDVLADPDRVGVEHVWGDLTEEEAQESSGGCS